MWGDYVNNIYVTLCICTYIYACVCVHNLTKLIYCGS